MKILKYILLLYVVIQGVAHATNIDNNIKNTILFLGDSLTEGYGLNKNQSYPALLEQKFKQENYSIKVINSGVSGSTSASIKTRLRWLMQLKPTHLILGIGANDGLRGQPVKVLQDNLTTTINLAKEYGLTVLLLGMRIPTNYGLEYTQNFAEVYPLVAKLTQTPLVPFLLENVAGNPELNLEDGIHPNTKGQSVVADNIYPYLKKLLLP